MTQDEEAAAQSGNCTCVSNRKAGKLPGGAVCIHAGLDQQLQHARLLNLSVELRAVAADVADEVAGLGSEPCIWVVQEGLGQAADVGSGQGLVVGGATSGSIAHQHEAAGQLRRAVVQVQNAAQCAE